MYRVLKTYSQSKWLQRQVVYSLGSRRYLVLTLHPIEPMPGQIFFSTLKSTCLVYRGGSAKGSSLADPSLPGISHCFIYIYIHTHILYWFIFVLQYHTVWHFVRLKSKSQSPEGFNSKKTTSCLSKISRLPPGPGYLSWNGSKKKLHGCFFICQMDLFGTNLQSAWVVSNCDRAFRFYHLLSDL